MVFYSRSATARSQCSYSNRHQPLSQGFKQPRLLNTKRSLVDLTPSGLLPVPLPLSPFLPHNFSGISSVYLAYNRGPSIGIIPLPAFCSVFILIGVGYVLVLLPSDRTNNTI